MRLVNGRGRAAAALCAGWLLFAGAQAMADTPANMLVVGQDTTDVQTIDPAFAFGHSDVEVANNLYDRLIVADQSDPSKFVPEIAAGWEFGDDGTTLTFRLRDGLRFHSGNPVTAEDVVFSLKRVVMLDGYITVFTRRFGWTKENIDEAVTAVDPLTVRLRLLDELSPSLALANISTVMGTIIDAKLVAENQRDGDWGSEWLKTNDAGSGPFKLGPFAPAAEGIVLVRNEDYLLDTPLMERIVIRNIPEPSAQRLLLEKGEIDLARNLTRDQLDAIEKGGKAKVARSPKWEMIWIATNRDHPVLGHPKVIEALRYLIDYRGMTDTFLKDDMVVNQSFWPGAGKIDDIYALDIDKARALLDEAGFGDGFSFRLEVQNQSPWPEVGQAIKSTMEKAGVEVTLVSEAYNTQMGNMRKRDFDATIGSFTAEYIDPDTFSPFYWNPDDRDEAQFTTSMAWRSHWYLPDLSLIAEAARIEGNEGIRNQLYRALQYSVQQKSPFIFLFRRNYSNGIAANVRGFTPLPIWGGVFYDRVYKE